MSFADALKAYGKDPAEIPQAAYRPGEALAYVEVHIEQGPLLEAERQPLGVVTGIVGQSRLRVTVTGEAGHAGTVPMKLRRDALAGAAEMMVESMDRRAQRRHGGDGRPPRRPARRDQYHPGTASFTVDLRDMDDTCAAGRDAGIRQQARAIAEARNLAVIFEPFHEVAAVACDARLQDTARRGDRRTRPSAPYDCPRAPAMTRR